MGIDGYYIQDIRISETLYLNCAKPGVRLGEKESLVHKLRPVLLRKAGKAGFMAAMLMRRESIVFTFS
jgi:hypothetical protein